MVCMETAQGNRKIARQWCEDCNPPTGTKAALLPPIWSSITCNVASTGTPDHPHNRATGPPSQTFCSSSKGGQGIRVHNRVYLWLKLEALKATHACLRLGGAVCTLFRDAFFFAFSQRSYFVTDRRRLNERTDSPCEDLTAHLFPVLVVCISTARISSHAKRYTRLRAAATSHTATRSGSITHRATEQNTGNSFATRNVAVYVVVEVGPTRSACCFAAC